MDSTAMVIPSSDCFFLLHPFEPFDQFIRHIHARHVFLQVASHTHRTHRGDTGQNIDLLMQAAGPDPFHPELKFSQVVDTLGLDEFGPGGDLLGKAWYPDVKGIAKRVGGGAHKHVGRSLDLVATEKFLFIAHVTHRLDKLHGIEIKDILGLRVITKNSDGRRTDTRRC